MSDTTARPIPASTGEHGSMPAWTTASTGVPTSSGAPAPTAGEIAAQVHHGDRSAVDVVTDALRRIAERDGGLGAFHVVRSERALLEAETVDRRPDRFGLPLAGVPVAVKDNVAVRGEPMRNGSPLTADAPQPTDHAVVARLRAAGAVVVGITRVPELCVFAATDSPFGITRNPWDRTRTPGGSSGGSAAAVASGMVPVAHAADGMGSIRIPAACCGLVGIKPGGGVVPAGLGPNDWYGMAENGALATTVADAALMLSVMADRPDLADVNEPDRPLRVAVSTKPPIAGVRPDLEHVRAVVRTVRLLEAAGHGVTRADPPYPVNPLPALARWVAGASADADGLDRSRLDRATRAHVALGDRVRARNLVKAADRDRFRAALGDWFSGFDLLVTPTLAAPPIEAARWGQRAWPRVFAANARYAPYAAPWNFAGYPAVSVPAGLHPGTGTPLAVQLVAPDGGERLLLGMAALIERLAPWPRTAPGS
ncbi:amidase [Intrasporangium oryzae NRRL B-24470]|uniref:Amidase n=1 Tax=Intrasporangium oryzae NRRL B-24470 TaxID=1386089 RepID=W9GF66_9MICO|nr:amidase [Intrasporangium oryzae]EWT02489.1 amidase [Intrasporangium oryzae NRRL B-24470]